MVRMFSKKYTYKINIRTPTTLNNKNLTISFAYTLGLHPQQKGFLNLIFITYLLFRFFSPSGFTKRGTFCEIKFFNSTLFL